MSIESNKLMNLADGKVLYDDLRERVEDVSQLALEKPDIAGTAGQVLTSDGDGGQSWQTPQSADIIDDTAGAGDTDKTFSADKLTADHTDVMNAIDQMGTPPEIKDSDSDGIDLDVSDPNGKVVLRLKNGEIQTKNFDSGTISKVEDSIKHGVDLDVSDTDGHVILRLKNGDLQTKNFDSSDFEKPLEEYSTSTTFDSSKTNTITINHGFKKGDVIYFHLEDGYTSAYYGKKATYYEDNNVVWLNRLGSNGYYRHVVTANCNTVGISIASNQYANETPLTLYVYKINGTIVPKIVTVKSDGTGMFTTIKAAIDSITDANHVTNPYIIEVYPGIYDTLEGYTDEEIASADIGGGYTQTSMVGVKLTDGMSIRGMGGRRDDVILTAELSKTKWSSAVRGNISTLNIQGEGNIENMTIIAKNLRYCVHDDFESPGNSHDKRIVRNVKFIGDDIAYAPLYTTYGSGMVKPRDFLFENCDFGLEVGIHSATQYSYGCTIVVNNCCGLAFRIGDNASAAAEAPNNVLINNCDFQQISIQHTHSDIGSHMQLEGVGCEYAMVYDLSCTPYKLGMIAVAPTGLTVGTMVKRQSSGLEFEVTNDKSLAYGVVVCSDNNFSYIQRIGYIPSNYIGLTGLSVGDYVTVNSDGEIVSGGTASNAVGIVTASHAIGLYDSVEFIKMLI